MNRFLLRLLTPLVLVTGMLTAQSPWAAAGQLLNSMPGHYVRLFGEVARNGNQFSLAHTNVQLMPFGRDLVPFVGQRVSVFGRQIGTYGTHRVTVLDCVTTDENFHFGGDAHIGGTLTLNIENANAAYFFLFLSLGRGYLPLNGLLPGLEGSLFLDPSTIITTHDGPLVNGNWQQSVWIPPYPWMIGFEVYMQAAVVPSNGLLRYLNSDLLIVQP